LENKLFNLIIIHPKTHTMKKLLFLSLFLLFALLNQAMAQDKTISGTVIDKATNTGLPGVSISVKGQPGVGTATDVNGAYSLSVPAGSTALEFRFIGYKTVERPIGAEANISVNLETDAKQLGEVVVTALGVERQERSLGFSTASVKGEELTKTRASSPMNALQGKVAGVNISTASGAPGASTKVIIRGYTSLSGDNNPLYVVDGVPIDNGSNNQSDALRTQDFGNRANDINPDDIESMSILKGASATALYGSRANAGVILITTKKGRASEKVNVDYTTSATFTKPLRLPQLQNRFGQGWSGHFAFEENGSWGPKLDGKDRLWGNIVDNSQQLKPFSAQKDNLKDFYETGTQFINTLGISGGTEKTNYYASYSYTTEDGIIPTDQDSYKRNTIGLRGSTKGKNLSISTSLNYVNKNAKVVSTGQGNGSAILYTELMQIPRDISIVDHKDLTNKFNTNDNYFTLYAQNPYFGLLNNGNKFEENRIYGNLNIDYKFNDWLTLKLRPGGDVSNSITRDFAAPFSQTDGSPNATASDGPGKVQERTALRRDLTGDAILTATNNINEDLRLTTLIGYGVNERFYRSTYASVTGLDIPGYYNLAGSPNTPIATTFESRRRLYGYYGSLDLSFRDYLFLNVMARNDWSSTLPVDDNSFFYPGANIAYVFTDVFTGLKSVLNYGKVRAAWGKTGKDAAPYSIKNVFEPSNISLGFGNIILPINGVSGYEVSNQLGNPVLKPELTREWELGTNLEFMSSRVKVDLSYYNKASTNQILNIPVAPSSGYTSKITNIGRVTNKGIELGLTVTPIRTDDFNWDIRYTFSNNRNKVEELFGNTKEVVLTSSYGISYVAAVGLPVGTFKGPGQLTAADGKIVVDGNGYPQQTADKVIYGNSQAKYLMGLYNDFSYKGVNFSFGFDYRKGGLMYSYTQRLSQFVGNTTNTLYNDRQPFIVPNSVVLVDTNPDGTPVYGENTHAILVDNVADYWNPQSNAPVEREHVIDRTYLKLREVALGYSIPKNYLTGLHISALNVSLVGRNLLLFTPKENNIIDPESTTFGNDISSDFGEFASGPTVRSMGASLKVTF
jgi:TonB-linked SusC/RagA family outer membrane protein